MQRNRPASDALHYAIAFSSEESRRTSLISLLQPLDVELDHFQHCFGKALGARLDRAAKNAMRVISPEI
jgi:hypothetical protein